MLTKNLLFTAVSGWAALTILAAAITAAYLLRRPVPATGSLQRPSHGTRMRPHFWLGLAIPALALVHAWPAMTGGGIAHVDQVGIDLASVAFLAAVGQAALGARLRGARSGRLRHLHRYTMIAIVVLTIGHVILNSTLVR